MDNSNENIKAEIIESTKKRKERTNKKNIEICIICAEKFNKVKRNPTKCQYCDFIACRECCETYILSENDPHCMNKDCMRTWTRQFISNSFTKQFCTLTLKNHRENVLFEKNKSSLPSIIPIIKIVKESEGIENEIKKLMIEEQNIKNRILEKRNNKFVLDMQIRRFYNDDITENENTKDKKIFIRPCPNDKCRGFLSSQWKCGICEIYVCSDCGDIKGQDNTIEHICKEENIKSMELLKKDTRPCPKCGTRIFKIEGCFGKNVSIKLYNGETILSQDVKEGCILMGDNGTPRKVIKCITGKDILYEVIQKNKMKYIVNSKHIMAFKYNESLVLISIEKYEKLNILDKEKYYGYYIENKKYNTTTININKYIEGNYYGWIVDGDNSLFQLEDGTIVHNCNQMFCTNCNTGFDWRTGKIINDEIHNPHYFEWLRRTGQNINRLDRNVNNGCGYERNRNIEIQFNEIFNQLKMIVLLKKTIEIDNYNNNNENYTLILPNNNIGIQSRYNNIPTNFWIKNKLNMLITKIYSIIQNTRHLRALILERYTNNNIREIRELQVEYLMNNIDENTFKIRIQQINKRTEKNREISDITNMLTDTVIGIMNRLYASIKSPEVFNNTINIPLFTEFCNNIDNYGFNSFIDISILKEIICIVDYANTCYKLISHAYQSTDIKINYILERIKNKNGCENKIDKNELPNVFDYFEEI